MLRGSGMPVLVHAENFNPPPGCLRVKTKEKYEVTRCSWLGDSESTIYEGELANTFSRAIKDNSVLGASTASKTVKPVDGTSAFSVPDSLFSNKKNCVFRSLSVLICPCHFPIHIQFVFMS